jgi:DNA-binding response OmpR family regulator
MRREKHVLLLESNTRARRRMAAALERAGIAVTQVADIQQALCCCKESAFGLIVAELKLFDPAHPSLSANPELHFPGSALLLLVEEELLETQAWQLPRTHDFVVKPVRLPEFVRRVQALLVHQTVSEATNTHLTEDVWRSDELEALQEVSSTIGRTLGLQETLTSTMAMARSLIRAAVSNVFLFSSDKKRLDSLITLSEDIELTDADRWQATIIAQAVMDSARAGHTDCAVVVPEQKTLSRGSLW